jgi:hypothetical protein
MSNLLFHVAQFIKRRFCSDQHRDASGRTALPARSWPPTVCRSSSADTTCARGSRPGHSAAPCWPPTRQAQRTGAARLPGARPPAARRRSGCRAGRWPTFSSCTSTWTLNAATRPEGGRPHGACRRRGRGSDSRHHRGLEAVPPAGRQTLPDREPVRADGCAGRPGRGLRQRGPDQPPRAAGGGPADSGPDGWEPMAATASSRDQHLAAIQVLR